LIRLAPQFDAWKDSNDGSRSRDPSAAKRKYKAGVVVMINTATGVMGAISMGEGPTGYDVKLEVRAAG